MCNGQNDHNCLTLLRAFAYLSGDCNSVVLLVSYRALILVLIVEHNGYAGFGNGSLALLVHQLLQRIHTNLNKDEQ